MKKNYDQASLEIIRFEAVDVIATSYDIGEDDDENEGEWT